MDKKYYLFETQLGWIAILFNDTKINSVFFAGIDPVTVHLDMEEKWGTKATFVKKAPPWLKSLAKKIEIHLSGKLQDFSEIDLDFSHTTDFRKKVYKQTMKIKAGTVMTYGQVAKKCGSPGAARAVGSAMASNPYLILMPCHRVVGSNGKMHGFSAFGGIETKERLLKAERAL